MIPVVFDGCFGWLHRRHDTENRDVAILLCPALNHDALNSHHAMRLLADQLAGAGYPAMRFDYPATGDSSDLDALPPGFGTELSEIWLNSINRAADFLRNKTGAQKLILCGLRIGATLAAIAATHRSDIAGLILLAPVLKGQSYLRQIWVESQLQNNTSAPIQDGICYQEIHFCPDTVNSIGAFDLRHWTVPNAARIAVFSQSQGPLLNQCCQEWSLAGADVSRFDFRGLEALLSFNIEDEKPNPCFDSILNWLTEQIPPGPILPADLQTGQAIQVRQNYIETPISFGTGYKLFGILCEAACSSTGKVVLIVNTGRDPRHGPGRFGVEFARLLAQEGIASFRFDFSGLGDSPGPPGQEAILSPLFDLDRCADISAAIDTVEKIGYRHFLVYGLCAGAYHAMQAALVEPRIEGLLLINLPFFKWSSGERGVDFIRHKNKAPHYFLLELVKLRSVGDARRKLAKSGSVLRGQLQQLSVRIKTASWLPESLRSLLAGGTLTIGQQSIEILSRRGVKSLFLFGDDDIGLDAVNHEFGGMPTSLANQAGVTMTILPDFDHLVADKKTRHKAAQSMIGFLTSLQRAES